MDNPAITRSVSIAPSRWNDDFLNSLRGIGDPLADAALAKLIASGETSAIGALFRTMDSNDATPPATTFPLLAEFFQATNDLPSGVDLDRVHRGEDVFLNHTFEGALVLLTKSLPEGYAAPNLSIILNISGQLRTHPYRRLLATLQTVLNVSTCRGFQRGGRAVITAQKLRLLHAGIRHITREARKDFGDRYGVPVNQEDMLATVMGFSLLVLKGWRAMGLKLPRKDEEDFLYLWLVFAHMMGIHPAGAPGSLAHLPVDLDDAMAFYDAFERRHYVEAAANPDGVALARANRKMLEGFVPGFLRVFGVRLLPRFCMAELMGKDMCERLLIPRLRIHTSIRFLFNVFHLALSFFDGGEFTSFERLGRLLFQNMITHAYGGTVTFTVPVSIGDLRTITDKTPASVAA